MSAIDAMLEHARSSHRLTTSPGKHPGRHVAVVACMDTRIDLYAIFGLAVGDVHIIRNAGGIVTDDVVRSLAISQRSLGTREVLLVHHSGCGLQGLTDDDFATLVPGAPPLDTGGFDNVEEDLRRCVHVLRSSPYLAHVEEIRAVVYDVTDGTVREVDPG